MCVSIYEYVYKSEGACEDQKWVLDALGLELQSGEDSPVCLLGIEPRPSVRALNAASHWAFSLTPDFLL